MEYLPEALSIMGIGVTVVFLTLSLLIIALWALSRLAPKRIVSAGEEEVSFDQEDTMVLGKTTPTSKNIRAAIIAVTLANSLENLKKEPKSSLEQKQQRAWWTRGLTDQFIDRTAPQAASTTWNIGKDWINRNYAEEEIAGRIVFNARAVESPSRKSTSTPNNKEAAAAAAVAIAQVIENPNSREPN